MTRTVLLFLLASVLEIRVAAFSQPAPHPRRTFRSIEDLLQWTSETAADTQQAEPLRLSKGLFFPDRRRRILHCHDYAGGYTVRADQDYLATFSKSWHHFDVFCYFSHHRVVVPPNIWIEACHSRDKVILGTFLFEGGSDSGPARDFLNTAERWKSCANQLVGLCVYYGFDGWLVNLETDLGVDRYDAFVGFLGYLQQQMKQQVGHHAQVIYYDAHDKDGMFQPQNALLGKQNKAFFDACDGIFINYQWFEFDTLPRCVAEAGPERQFDVYAGIDVWARNCDYTEGAGCQPAVDAAIEKGVSLAIFAPGWVQEKGPGSTELPGSAAAQDVDVSFWNKILAPKSTSAAKL